MSDLMQKHCESCEGIGSALQAEQIKNLMPQLSNDWQINKDSTSIKRELRFANFHETMAFVNGLAWMAHQENHHPDLEVGYNYCRILYTTHALGGLSMNDFICAAKVDALLMG